MSFDFGSLENKKKSSSFPQGTKTTSTKSSSKSEVPKVDFSNLGGSTGKTSSKSSGKTSTNKTSSKKTSTSRSATRARGKKGSQIKGVDNAMLMYGGIGGGILLLLIIVMLCFTGEKTASSPVNSVAQKRTYLDQANDYTNKNEFQKAIAAYEKAYKLDPDDSYATDQISIIYRNNLHDEAQAEYWKSKSEQITSNKVDSNRGASARAYAEKAERKAKKQNNR